MINKFVILLPSILDKAFKGEAVTPIPSFPLNGEGECRVFMNTLITTKVNGWLCDALEARLQSADAKRERLIRGVMAGVRG